MPRGSVRPADNLIEISAPHMHDSPQQPYSKFGKTNSRADFVDSHHTLRQFTSPVTVDTYQSPLTHVKYTSPVHAPIFSRNPALPATTYAPQASRKEIKPYKFDGTSSEWSDYVIHFGQAATWNIWDDSQKACMLSFHLRGEAQRLLSTLNQTQRFSLSL